MKSQIQLLTYFAVVLSIFGAWPCPALGDQQQQPFSFQVQKSDVAKAEKLTDELASLSPRVNRDEAKLLADCAFATVTKLRREYRMFGTPIFNNFLIYHGLRKRGYCYQWSEDLLVALDKLNLKSLEVRWGEYDPNTWRENNCIVVTAKGQPFKRESCWSVGGIWDTSTSVWLPPIGRLTWRTARMRAVSAKEQQARRFRSVIIPSLFSEAL